MVTAEKQNKKYTKTGFNFGLKVTEQRIKARTHAKIHKNINNY